MPKYAGAKTPKYKVGDKVLFDNVGILYTQKAFGTILQVEEIYGQFSYLFEIGPRRRYLLSEEHIIDKMQEGGIVPDSAVVPAGKKLRDWISEKDSNTDLREAIEAHLKGQQETPTNDPVNHPNHYTQGGIECIDALEAATIHLAGWKATLTYQVMKYLWRWDGKGKPLEDLKKARFYLDRLIAKVEKEEK